MKRSDETFVSQFLALALVHLPPLAAAVDSRFERRARQDSLRQVTSARARASANVLAPIWG